MISQEHDILNRSAEQIFSNNIEDFFTEFSQQELPTVLRQEQKLKQLEYTEPRYGGKIIFHGSGKHRRSWLKVCARLT